MIRVATDVGGTFTDFIAFDEARGRLVSSKCLSTPNVIQGIVDCFDKSGTRPAEMAFFVHGSTVAINAVVERKGAKAGLLTTEGFLHTLDLGRGNILNAFDLMFRTPTPLIPPSLRRGVVERMLADGSIHVPLDTAQAMRVTGELVGLGVEAIAICFLHSYANPEHEQALKHLIEARYPSLYVTASSDIIRQYREYERTSTTVLNAYVGPKVGAYMQELSGHLAREHFSGAPMMMQSNGGTMTIEAARVQPVRLMESGPVGGTMAAAHVGRMLGCRNVVAFDMGGTTAKVSIVNNGVVEIADGYFIGGEETGYPLQLPVVDIIEIGAGGGSIAHLDETGALKIGPESAGAVPGPACYARGGARPTVTDADLVLGRLNPDYFLGGEMVLDREGAARAIGAAVAAPLGLDTIVTADGIVRLADLSMAHAVQAMTVQRGYDPREAVMVAYGGAGPVHAVAVARELGIPTIVVPPYCGIFSAVGMLLADAANEYVISHIRPYDPAVAAEIDGRFGAMAEGGIAAMAQSGFARERITTHRMLEMRYTGQEFALLVGIPAGPLAPNMGEIAERFHRDYEARYGHAFPGVKPEIVSLRMRVVGVLNKPDLSFDSRARDLEAMPPTRRAVYFDGSGWTDCSVYRRTALAAGFEAEGPAVVEEAQSSTIVWPGDRFQVDERLNLIVSVGSGAEHAPHRWGRDVTAARPLTSDARAS